MASEVRKPWTVNQRNDEIFESRLGEPDAEGHIPWAGPIYGNRPRMITTEGRCISPFRYQARQINDEFDCTLVYSQVCDADFPCLNPDHIRGLTRKEKRLFYSNLVKKIDTKPATRFTDEEVKEMRDLHKTLGLTNLSVIYGAPQRTIEEVVYRKVYTHVV